YSFTQTILYSPFFVCFSVYSVKATEIDSWYIDDSTRPVVSAVDVSSHQSGLTETNYQNLKLLGVKTIIVKATEGSSYTNSYALTQMKYAANAGLNVALYQYAKYTTATEAETEANYLLTWLKENNVNTDILIFSDIEAEASEVSSVGSNLSVFQSVLFSGGYTNQGFYASKSSTYLSSLVAVGRQLMVKSTTFIKTVNY
ncbi:GH25 family lysozyme, partial [Liquorilactobacillus mali]